MRTITCLVTVTTLLLTACSTSMTKDECQTVDWRTVGYEDGVAGRPGDRIARHRKACAEHGGARLPLGGQWVRVCALLTPCRVSCRPR